MGNKGAYSSSIKVTSEGFARELDGFMSLLHGEEMTVGYDDFVLPVFVMNAISRAEKSGEWEKVGRAEV